MLSIKNQPNYKTIIVHSNSQDELGRTFIRFQEHYESCNTDFKGKVFTLGQFKNWYSITYGTDSYHHDWKGFNFPSTVLKPFRDGLFDPLTSYEIDLLERLKYRNDTFYIVGANENSILQHELAHALYFCDNNYRLKINRIFDKYKKNIKQILQYILNKGYHKDVLYDELQAYIVDNDDKFIIDNSPKDLIQTIRKLHAYYTEKRNLIK
jgi:hypothetical protein